MRKWLSLVVLMHLLPNPAAADDPAHGLLLVTLDTTRADVLGPVGAGMASTPVMDRLAARGVRFTHALAPAPLTLPSHASLLTGLDPPQHGVRSNGSDALPQALPTLATTLAAHGFATAAVVGSRVLDHRFGLARGFGTYDDIMPAENRGQYGYPERDAAAVTDRAIAWLATLEARQRFFLWVHYYDPHAPYSPPEGSPGDDPASSYRGEVEHVDRQLGRLLDAAVPSANVLVAVVGDHGEALGDHGETTHGIFLYDQVLRVPLILAGPSVPAGQTVSGPVAISRLAPTLLELLGVAPPATMMTGLEASDRPVYSETLFPAAVHGWAPLAAITTGRWRFIRAPRAELYDLTADADELRNLAAERPEVASRLAHDLEQLAALEPAAAPAGRPAVDAEIEAALTALGYVHGATPETGDGIDPKDGIAMLGELEAATAQLGRSPDRAVARLRALVERNPANIVFRSRLALALLTSGDPGGAVAQYRVVVERVPGSEFMRLRLAEALRHAGKPEAAAATAREALAVDPRFAAAWRLLADLEQDPAERRAVLREALAAGVTSTAVLRAAARLEPQAEAAEPLLSRAALLAPGDPAVWLDWGLVAYAGGHLETAAQRLRTAVELDPAGPAATLALGRALLEQEDPAARGHLLRAAVLGRGTAIEAEARDLLERGSLPQAVEER